VLRQLWGLLPRFGTLIPVPAIKRTGTIRDACNGRHGLIERWVAPFHTSEQARRIRLDLEFFDVLRLGDVAKAPPKAVFQGPRSTRRSLGSENDIHSRQTFDAG
jgi:hypothetical protein